MSGLLGNAELAANVWTAVAVFPAGLKSVTFNYLVINNTISTAKVEMFVAKTNPPESKERVQSDLYLKPGTDDERTALVGGSGEMVMVRSTVAGVVVRVHGHTQEAIA